MSKPITRRSTKPPACQLCDEPLETAATSNNPAATIRPNCLARCPSCLVLFVLGADLRPVFDDVDAFDAAMNADPEVRAWALKTLESARIRRATEFKAECAAAREWLIERSYPDVEDDLAVLDAYVAGFDATGRTSASADIRFKASGILAEMPRQTEDQAGVAARQAQPRLPASPLAAGA